MRRSQACSDDAKWPSDGGERARRQIPELMAADAAHVLHPHEITVAAARQFRGLRLVRNLHHRVPVRGGIALGGGGGIRSDHRGQIQAPAARCGDFRRIGEAVAPDPHPILGGGQLRQEVAAGLVGNDDLGEAGLEVVGLRDHPDAGLGAARARDRAGDLVGADPRRIVGRSRERSERRHEPGHADGTQHADGAHGPSCRAGEIRHIVPTAFRPRMTYSNRTAQEVGVGSGSVGYALTSDSGRIGAHRR